MIEIINNTMINPITTECKDCKSTFSFTYDDIQSKECTDFWGFGKNMYERYIICPVCKYKNYIDKITKIGEKE